MASKMREWQKNMAKKKRRKDDKKRNLKYGRAGEEGEKKYSNEDQSSQDFNTVSKLEKPNPKIKRELKKNLIFVGIFLIILLVIDFLLNKTNLLNPVLNLFGLKGIYGK